MGFAEFEQHKNNMHNVTTLVYHAHILKKEETSPFNNTDSIDYVMSFFLTLPLKVLIVCFSLSV